VRNGASRFEPKKQGKMGMGGGSEGSAPCDWERRGGGVRCPATSGSGGQANRGVWWGSGTGGGGMWAVPRVGCWATALGPAQMKQ
jgi:hypothetical protein